RFAGAGDGGGVCRGRGRGPGRARRGGAGPGPRERPGGGDQCLPARLRDGLTAETRKARRQVSFLPARLPRRPLRPLLGDEGGVVVAVDEHAAVELAVEVEDGPAAAGQLVRL